MICAREVDCDSCGGHAEGNNVKQICIHCHNEVIKEVMKLRKKVVRLEKKLDANGGKTE